MEDANRCSKCGKPICSRFCKDSLSLVKEMKDRHLCYTCMFWLDMANNTQKDMYVIDDSLYKLVPLKNNKRLNKQMAFIINIQTGEPIASEDYQLIGKIPDRFKYLYKTEYKFITKHAYSIMRKYEGGPCMRKGCFDRYECYWYKPELAEPDGPWNTIPQTYHTGDEMCESFINKNCIYATDHPTSAHPIE